MTRQKYREYVMILKIKKNLNFYKKNSPERLGNSSGKSKLFMFPGVGL